MPAGFIYIFRILQTKDSFDFFHNRILLIMQMSNFFFRIDTEISFKHFMIASPKNHKYLGKLKIISDMIIKIGLD